MHFLYRHHLQRRQARLPARLLPRPPACRDCGAGLPPALLESSDDGKCVYAVCGQPSALTPDEAPAPAPTRNAAAAAAAPAIVLTLAVVAFVELLMHFC